MFQVRKNIEVNFLKKGKFELDLWLCNPYPESPKEKRAILITPPNFKKFKRSVTERQKLLYKIYSSMILPTKSHPKLNIQHNHQVYNDNNNNVEDNLEKWIKRKPARLMKVFAPTRK